MGRSGVRRWVLRTVRPSTGVSGAGAGQKMSHDSLGPNSAGPSLQRVCLHCSAGLNTSLSATAAAVLINRLRRRRQPRARSRPSWCRHWLAERRSIEDL